MRYPPHQAAGSRRRPARGQPHMRPLGLPADGYSGQRPKTGGPTVTGTGGLGDPAEPATPPGDPEAHSLRQPSAGRRPRPPGPWPPAAHGTRPLRSRRPTPRDAVTPTRLRLRGTCRSRWQAIRVSFRGRAPGPACAITRPAGPRAGSSCAGRPTSPLAGPGNPHRALSVSPAGFRARGEAVATAEVAPHGAPAWLVSAPAEPATGRIFCPYQPLTEASCRSCRMFNRLLWVTPRCREVKR
jgi:hypothetical protein